MLVVMRVLPVGETPEVGLVVSSPVVVVVVAAGQGSEHGAPAPSGAGWGGWGVSYPAYAWRKALTSGPAVWEPETPSAT